MSEDRLARLAAVDSSVRSRRVHTLEAWPSTVQLIIALYEYVGFLADRLYDMVRK